MSESKIVCTNTYDRWYKDRKVVIDDLYFQDDICSAQNINSPKYLIAANQSLARIGVLNKAKTIALFGNLDVRRYFVGIDCQIYPKDAIITNYDGNDYLDEYRDLKLFYKENVVEELSKLFISYPNLKNFYPSQVSDLRHQIHDINPKKIQLFEEYRSGPANANFFVILVRQREIKMILHGEKPVKLNIYKN